MEVDGESKRARPADVDSASEAKRLKDASAATASQPTTIVVKQEPGEGVGESPHIKTEPETDAPVANDSNLAATINVKSEPEPTAPKRSVLGDEKLAPAPTRMLHGCEVYASLPPNWVAPPFTPPDKPARTWPFVLDDFQNVSIECLEKRESVLVAAHTSAGKTVVAEYAIALALASNSRVIYTSPIKALSNQKYRELKDEFEDVGLMTGDVNINATASCVVMTTEILRNMLLRGHEMMREVSWVIFDEVHYMRDYERGVVWEESIILLSPSIHLVFLSATLSNASEFADWICSLKEKPCHVVTTDYRPTPLVHYVFPPGGTGLFKVVDASGTFHDDAFQEAKTAVDWASRTMKDNGDSRSDLMRIVSLAKENSWLPLIVFNFSRREVEGRAIAVAKLDLLNAEEKGLVEQVFESAIAGLAEEDRELLQIKTLLPLLKRGIGVHHSGLLPILKEVVEILFSESLTKVLFATETFAMGVNMPAKTVVFSNLQKFDGKSFRWLSSGEYIQMSGRAGRRNTDKEGICIMMVDEDLELKTARQIVQGTPDPLNSSFRLSYNMILNLLRVESAIDSEHIIRKSLHQFQFVSKLPKLGDRVRELEAEAQAAQCVLDDATEEYCNVASILADLDLKMADLMRTPSAALRFLQPGRVVKVKGTPLPQPPSTKSFMEKAMEAAANKASDDDGDTADWGWCVVMGWRKRFAPSGYVVEVLCPVGEMTVVKNLQIPKPISAAQRALLKQQVRIKQQVGGLDQGLGGVRFEILQVSLAMIQRISAVRLFLPNDLRPPAARHQLFMRVLEAEHDCGQLPLLQARDVQLEGEEPKKISQRMQSLQARLAASPVAKLPAHERLHLQSMHARQRTVRERATKLRKFEKHSHLIQYRLELKNRLKVLRRLDHLNVVMTQKGKVAAEVESVDELVLTELVFDGLFLSLDTASAAATISCMFGSEKTKTSIPMPMELQKLGDKVKEVATRVGQIQIDAGIELELGEYTAQFEPVLMHLVYEWCSGKSFPEICLMTDMFEGSIIRTIRRLEELLRQLCDAADAIGNADLKAKFADARKAIRRGIMFAGSLYL